ncbi:MAG: hypothetical protein ACYC75_00240 [Minisyncoccota bacterium]
MTYLIFILVTLALLAGFSLLTWYETERGIRLFAPLRMRLDQRVERVEFVLSHVDLSAFLRDAIRALARRVAHDVAHLSLQAVRAVERLLTRLVRRFRMRQAVTAAPRGNARAFVKTLSDFKNGLKAAQPDALDIR